MESETQQTSSSGPHSGTSVQPTGPGTTGEQPIDSADTMAQSTGEIDSGNTDHTTGAADTGSETTAGSTSEGSGGETGERPVLDCATIPDAPLSHTLLEGPRGYHGLIITPDGRMIGSDGTSLIASTYAGDWQVFIPGIGAGEQMDWLADGDFVFSTSDNNLTRISLDGTTSVIRPNTAAYGVTVGPDEMIYVVPNYASENILRVHPTSGDTETLITLDSPGLRAHSLGFSPDAQILYIGTLSFGQEGMPTTPDLLYVELDAAMNPSTAPQTLTTEVGDAEAGWHDGIAVDACGNLYVTDYVTSSIFRVSPSGETIVYWVPDNVPDEYGHGVVWGTGSHGWNDEALYIPQSYNGNTVTEIIVGVPSSSFSGTVINHERP